MILKFKNKYMMSLNGMIADASQAGGIPDFILLEAQEAFNFLLEASKLKKKYQGILTINCGNINSTMSIWNPDITRQQLKEMTEEWYKLKYTVFYNNIELRIIKQKKEIPPPEKIIKKEIIRYNLEGKICDECGSSIRRFWWFGYDKGCINRHCTNYYGYKNK